MKKIYGYISSAIYNIRHNKAYAAFVTFGTALTFIFIVIILQLTNEIINSVPPFVNAERQIYIEAYSQFRTKSGDIRHTGFKLNEIPLLLEDIDNYELCALSDTKQSSVFTNNRFTHRTLTKYVNGDYWKINKFDFTKGRSFTEKEALSKAPVAVISIAFANSNFKTDEVLGGKLELNNTTYTVIGVVDEYANLINGPIAIWLPYKSSDVLYNLNILPKEDVGIDEFKSEVLHALKVHFAKKSIDIDPNSINIPTLVEYRIADTGADILSYGIAIILLILLIIPAINIIAVSIANINNRATEIAIRRSMGATIFSSFILIIVENLLLVSIGAIIGILLSFPFGDLLENIYAKNFVFGKVSIINKSNIWTPIFYTIPLVFLFTLLSGGIPAYLIAKGKIAKILKGELSKNTSTFRRVSGIMFEQVLIFIILMVSIVSIFMAVKAYNRTGLIDVENIVTFTCLGPKNDATSSQNIKNLVENLRKDPNVKALSIENKFAPYHHYPDRDTIMIDKTEIYASIRYTDENTIDVFELKLTEGRWFTKESISDKSLQVIITNDIADRLNWSESVGRKISIGGLDYIVVGVLDGLRQNAFYRHFPSIILPYVSNNISTVSVKVKDVDAFTVDLHNQWKKLITNKKLTFAITDLESEQRNDIAGKMISITAMVVPTIFLLIFAFIGTFGIFWLTSQKRVKEFALRIAVGSTPKRLMWLVIKESIIITSIAMIPGLLLSIFIYEFTLGHFMAIGITVILMFIFSIFSAWYPAYMVSKINPANALKDD